MHQCHPAARLNKSSQRLAAICINKALAIRTNAVIRTLPTAPDSSPGGRIGARTAEQTALPRLLVYASDKRSNHMKAETGIEDKGLCGLRARHTFTCSTPPWFLFWLLTFKCSLDTTTA